MGRWAILNGVLVVIVLLLGLQIGRTWRRTLPPVDVSARHTDSTPKGEAKPEGKGGAGRRGGKRGGAPEKAEPQPAVMVTTIVNKDLFDPSRQKATEEVKAPPPKEIGPPPNLTLVGVRMIGRDREVLVTDAAQANQQRRLRVGDQIGGYTLKSVHPSRVTLASASGETMTLSLAIEKSGGAGAAPGAAPRPPGSPTPPRPGQPGAPQGMAAPSPAAGIQPTPPTPPAPAAPGGVQPRQPRAARGAAPGIPPVPGAAPPPATGAQPHQPAPPSAFNNPNLPAAVREKLEQLRSN
jgi:hypothetical protein